MTQEDKQLLLRDLSGRVSYEVKFILPGGNINNIYTMKGIDLIATDEGIWDYGVTTKNTEPIEIRYIKPYLRPMSSMTWEEKKEFSIFGFEVIDHINANREGCPKYQVIEVSNFSGITEITDWLNAHHFDYNGLIEKGLALEAPEGMYI